MPPQGDSGSRGSPPADEVINVFPVDNTGPGKLWGGIPEF